MGIFDNLFNRKNIKDSPKEKNDKICRLNSLTIQLNELLALDCYVSKRQYKVVKDESAEIIDFFNALIEGDLLKTFCESIVKLVKSLL